MDNENIYKISLVIALCEGKTDIPYLNIPLDAYFQDKYGAKCKIVSIGGDVTSDLSIDDCDYIKIVSDYIEEKLGDSKNKIDCDIAKNIKEIVHIIDIDQAYISEDKMTVDPEVEGFLYTRQGTISNSKNKIKERNANKIKNINKLLSTKTLNIFGSEIPYSLYFYSVNIDDFYNENALNLSSSDKARLAALFERRYLLKQTNKGKVKLFLDLIKNNNPDNFPNNLKESWDYITFDNHSLLKCSNVNMIIEKEKR